MKQQLPIDRILPELVDRLNNGSNLVLQAAPGAGKTTRVPPVLLDAQFCQGKEVLVLEPRRLAAKMAARRVAWERGEAVGETIGYQFRFENVSSARTRLRFLTEGMLMRRLLSDPELRGVGAVVLDEFHERHLHGDIALAFLRRLQLTVRPDLRLIVMSATLDGERVAEFLGEPSKPCARMDVEGRLFGVDVDYLPTGTARGDLESAVCAAVRRALEEDLTGVGPADILVFLPGMAEIRRSTEALAVLAEREDLLILPLHGELSREEQDRAVSPAAKRKVILATNVAETSITIEGVTTVIDSGLARVASTSWWSGLPALRTRPISRASAIQRAGRAGRVRPGRCFRLYSKHDFDSRQQFDVPEIARADLSQTLLELKVLGVDDAENFGWFEAPASANVQAASRLLYLLGAIEAAAGSASLTELGRKMVELPVHPRLARVLLEAERRGVVGQAVNAVVEMSDGRVELRDRLLSAMRARSVPVGVDDSVDLRFSVLCGFPDRVGRKRKNEFLLCSGGAARIDSSLSDAFSEYAVAVDVEERKAHGQIRPETYLRAVYPIEADWLLELTPSMLKDADEFTWTGERVEAVSRLKYDQLMITESRESARDRRGVAEFLAKQVWAGGLARICDVERLENLRARMAFIRQHVGGEFLALNDEEVLRLLTEFCEGKISLSEVRDGDFLAYILAVFPADQFKVLERDAPEAVVLKRGRRVRVHYENDKPPWIESRLQDFFGMPSGPVLAGGRVPLTLHLLAPNQRAVQVTSDLAGFWARNYPALRKELGRRYPRHAWPEDPL